ncbi:MAG: RNA polymerase sigma factor [Bacteroidota bacterium]
MTEQEMIQGCKAGDRKAQKLLYESYSPKLFGVVKRYVKSPEDAEDVLIEGFFKVMTKIDLYSGSGSFMGWMRRIMVNEALMFLRKNNNFNMTVEINNNLHMPTKVTVEDQLAADAILALLDKLPVGYRTVFNLYVLEGYKHREIAEELGISINTSKSQLILARKRLRELIQFQEFPGVG